MVRFPGVVVPRWNRKWQMRRRLAPSATRTEAQNRSNFSGKLAFNPLLSITEPLRFQRFLKRSKRANTMVGTGRSSEWYSHWIAGREEVEAAEGQVTVLALKPGSNPDRP